MTYVFQEEGTVALPSLVLRWWDLDDERLEVGPLQGVCLECLSDEERRALQHDLDSAARVQAHLLPARNFSFGRWQISYHYQPLGAVSGDHIDLIRR